MRAVTDQAGAVVARHDYARRSAREIGSSSQGGHAAFTGKPRDVETGLDYFGARYYSNWTGRFTTVDPALDQSVALLDPQQWNRYAYARNNPTRYIDPDGRQLAAHMFHRIPDDKKETKVAIAAAAAIYGGPVVWRAAVGCFLSPACQASVLNLGEGAAGGAPTVLGNVGRLSQAELATGNRLAQRLGGAVRVSEHEGAEFVSAAGKTFDALGTPAAYRFWNEGQFLASIDRHLLKASILRLSTRRRE